MKKIELKAKKREVSTKGALNKFRKEFIPAVTYGKGIAPLPILVNKKDFMGILKHEGTNIIIDLDVEGSRYPTIIKGLQRDPIKDDILNIDFQKVELDKPVITKIPIVTIGKAKGEKTGGLLEHMLYELEIEAKPLDIPEKIEVDVTPMDINDVVYVKDLALSDKVKVITPLETVVVQVGHPAKEEVAEVTAAEETEGAEKEAGKEEAEGKKETVKAEEKKG